MPNRQRNKSGRRPAWITAVSFVTVLAIVLAVVFFQSGSMSIRAIERPNYPETGSFGSPADLSRLTDYPLDASYLEAFTDFTVRSAVQIVGGSRSQNQLYSPLSLWFALAVCADSASGNIRQEILQTLSLSGFQSDWIGSQSSMLFKRLYFENEVGRLKILNALWLHNKTPFKRDFLKKAAETYFTESNQIDFGNDSAYQTISNWANQQTGGRLTERLQRFFQSLFNSTGGSGQSAGGAAALALVNSVSFADQWTERFDETLTTPGLFHLSDGGTVNPLFMRRKFQYHAFMAAEGYTAAAISFKNRSSMLFILPDVGETPQSILANADWMKQIIGMKNQQEGEVIFKIPMFDLKSEVKNISESLKAMGVRDAFDSLKADFSALSDEKPLWLGRIEQSVRVKIDEQGCTADTVTGVRITAASALLGSCEMNLDRPFIFIILGEDQYPLFIGVVNNPTA